RTTTHLSNLSTILCRAATISGGEGTGSRESRTAASGLSFSDRTSASVRLEAATQWHPMVLSKMRTLSHTNWCAPIIKIVGRLRVDGVGIRGAGQAASFLRILSLVGLHLLRAAL